jgi:hypothetical protein
MHTPDLTHRPPRSPRVRLGGYVLLARILDKCRATLAGKNGEYNFNCPLDRRFFEFVQLDAEAFKKQVEYGSGDGQMLAWVAEHSKVKPAITEILSWSAFEEQRVPGDVEMREFFHGLHKKVAPHRADIYTWFDLLDVDDHVSFGGKA